VPIAEDWAAGGDELTPTMNLKRKPIAEMHANEIENPKTYTVEGEWPC
jgi:hypothetical protein